MSKILEQLNDFRTKIVHIMSNITWLAKQQAEIVLIIILWYIVVLLLLILIHRKTLKRYKKTHEHLIFLYDTIQYQVAKAQYGNPSIQEAKGIKVVIEAEKKNYLANAKIIREEIISIEERLGQQIVSKEQRNTIYKKTKKKAWAKAFMEIIGRFTTCITAGIYKLFW